MGKIVPILAPKQQNRIKVNGYTDNVPIGPGLMREGITNNLVLSQKRADSVMQFMISRASTPARCPRRVSAREDPVASNTQRRAGRRTGAWN